MKPTSVVRPEFVFGVVGATGTDIEGVCRELEAALAAVGYTSETIRVIHLLHEFPRWAGLATEPEEKRLHEHMEAGDQFRESAGRGDALALLSLGAIRESRQETGGSSTAPVSARAYLLRGLKHPEEIATLKRVYGPNFWLVGAYSARHSRVTQLATKIAHSHHSTAVDDFRSASEELVQRDQEEPGRELGQQLRDTFPLSDVFVNAADVQGARAGIRRFVEILFGHQFHTPTRDEYGMFHAQAAALRSSALGRQVGATITSQSGDVIAVGTNEVPKAGGGLYWADDESDGRDFTLGYDSIDRIKKEMLAEIVVRFREKGWLTPSKASVEVLDLLTEARSLMHGSQLMSVLEYGRAVHAEMAALMEASRRGVSVSGGTLYATTFPCHNCSRHIVAAGVRRVVYVEPYPKSLTSLLHLDAISTEEAAVRPDQVKFEPFVGIAPKKYMDSFEMLERKEADGNVVRWNPTTAEPRFVGSEPSYLKREAEEFDSLKGIIDRAGLLRDVLENNDAEAGLA